MDLVIGGGPAGRLAAMRLARGGHSVRLVEKGGVGGQCLHQGCMVICALNDAARTIRSAHMLSGMGILDSFPRIVFPRILREMEGIQQKIEGILRDETADAGVELVHGEGSFRNRRAYIDGKYVDAQSIILATGSRPSIPDIPGIRLSGVFTPHTLGTMEKLPEKLVIIGCGAMGAEFSYIFHSFGCEVTLVCRSDLLKNLDPFMVQCARRELSGVRIRENTTPIRILGERAASGVLVQSNRKEEAIEADAVFLATGLIPRTENIEGLELGPAGEIRVDDHMRTSIAGVYACGDVIGAPFLTPVARMEGIVAADNILGCDRRMDYGWIPQSIALMNEFAFCTGPAEPSFSMKMPSPAGPGSFWSVPNGLTGCVRVTIGEESGRIQGIAAASPGAGIMAHYMAQLMRHG
ncbi:MAG: NAD(P)/FAD-dependent oxidoreductase, partial [Methanomicrobiales archaeon]|nr:NAD(P)/FAD-dependent oxidoreductase [Methanomicrobiales archaeon]